MALSKISRIYRDGNLVRAGGTEKLNRSIAIFGTSEDGPVNRPTLIKDLDHAGEVFGRFGQGSLVRAIQEAWSAQLESGGQPQIYAVRIGSQYAQKAFTYILSGSSVSLRLQALNPGDVYNDVVIMQEGNLVKVYNPKTDIWSVFSYSANANDTLADVHNVSELADAINADPNLNTILVAESIDKAVHYEAQLNSSDSSVVDVASATETILDLTGLVAGDLVATSRYLDKAPNDEYDPSTDNNNPIVAIESVYAIADGGLIEHEIKGKTSVKLPYLPLDGKNDDRYNTVGSAGKPQGSAGFPAIMQNSEDQVVSEAYLRYRSTPLGSIQEDPENLGKALYTFEVDAPFGIAHDTDIATDLVGLWGEFPLYGFADEATAAAYAKAPAGSIFSATEMLQIDILPSGGGSNSWSKLYSDQDTKALALTTDFTLSWDSAATKKLTITITSAALKTVLDQNIGGKLQVSFDSCIDLMSEAQTLATVNASTAKFTDYFVRGNEIVFGAPVPANLVFRTARLTRYDLGSTLQLLDQASPKIKLIGSGNQPGPGGTALGTSDVVFGFKYTFSPDWPTFTSKSMSNGTNGVNLTNEQLYTEIENAIDELDERQYGIIVFPGAYLDSTKVGYNSVTGLPQEENADFQSLMSNLLQKQRGAATGVISFKPLVGSGLSKTVTRADVANRAVKITEQNLGDPLRAANFLSPFADKFMIAVDFEPILTSNGIPYSTTPESLVAGYLSTLAENESIYTDSIPGIAGLRYSYSYEQLNALSDARVISVQRAGTRSFRLTDGPTLAAPGSDYERYTTIQIVRRALDLVEGVVNGYRGRPAGTEMLQAMETRAKSALGSMIPNYLNSFSIRLKSSPEERVIGRVTIYLTLSPLFEIRDIQIITELSSEGSGYDSLVNA